MKSFSSLWVSDFFSVLDLLLMTVVSYCSIAAFLGFSAQVQNLIPCTPNSRQSPKTATIHKSISLECQILTITIKKYQLTLIIIELLNKNSKMDPPEPQKHVEKGQEEKEKVENDQLNQFGRPKQKVVFYQFTEDMKKEAREKLEQDKMVDSEEVYEKAKNDTQKVWDKFYKFHKCSFFKDRTYLEREIQPITIFKNMYAKTKKISEFVELGCGVGNTLFPLLREYPCFNYFGFDISAKAISLIEEQMVKHPEFEGRMKVAVANLVTDQIPFKGHGDLSTLIFVLSAIVPEKHFDVMQKISDWMRPGSFLYFRDYGRYDFGQLNLSSKGNRKLRQNFYMKNDGVCVYYFDQQQIENLFQKVGLVKIKCSNLCKLLQNRKRDLKMYRVWLQCLFYKPPIAQQLLLQLKNLELQEQELKQEESQEQNEEPKQEKTDKAHQNQKQEQKQEHSHST